MTLIQQLVQTGELAFAYIEGDRIDTLSLHFHGRSFANSQLDNKIYKYQSRNIIGTDVAYLEFRLNPDSVFAMNSLPSQLKKYPLGICSYCFGALSLAGSIYLAVEGNYYLAAVSGYVGGVSIALGHWSLSTKNNRSERIQL